MESLSFDTTFLIDFQRERNQGKPGAVHRFLETHRESPAYLSTVALGEFAEGFKEFTGAGFLSVVESFELLEINRKVALTYAKMTRFLRAQGKLIGSNDLWIAATARTHSLPLVTRNAAHFSRVPDLQIIEY